MIVLAILSWVVWMIVFAVSLSRKEEGYGGIPYSVMLLWFIINTAMLAA